MIKNGPVPHVAVLREVATTLFACESCEESGVGDKWMYEHADQTLHERYEATTNPWP